MESDSQHIRVCALVLSVASFFLFIAAETLQYEGQRAHRTVLTLVALGALGFAWIGPLTLLAGSLHSPKFKWWQPFEGGVEFVWMQAFGWSLDALVLAASVVVLANFRIHEWFQGLYLLLGVTGFCAQILLNLSISSFVEQDMRPPVFRFRLNTKAVVSLLISASGTLMFVVYDAWTHLMQSTVIITLACSQFAISAVIIHVVYGCLEIPGYRFWQPFEGDRMFLLLQYLGWQFFACVVTGSIMLCVDPDANRQVSRAYSVGTATTLGMMGFTSQVLLLISLQFFVQEKNMVNHTSRQSAAATFVDTKAWRSPEAMVSALLSASALLVGLLSYTSRTTEWMALYPAVQAFRYHESAWWGISMFALVLATPIAQMSSVRTNHSFRWWQPFAGGTRFVFLQMIGWFWYGTFLALNIVLWMNRQFIGDPVSLCVLTLGAASAFTVTISLQYFKAPKSALSDPESYTAKPFVARSDAALLLIFALACAFFHVIVDVFHERMAVVARVMCVGLGTGSSVLCCGIAQMSGSRYFSTYRFWQPFEGGTRYVIRQAIGWTLFAVQLLFDSLLLSIIAWQRAPVGVPSLIGLFSLIPHFLIASSIAYFRNGAPSRDNDENLRTASAVRWNDMWRETPIQWRVVVNLVVAVGSMSLFVGAEMVHGSDRIQSAEVVLHLFGFLSAVCGMSLGHCVLGPKMHGTYRLFQPFRGGTRFITLQGAAWTLMSMGWAVACTVLFWSEQFFRVKGIHLMTGILFFVAQTLLLYSLPLFQPRVLNGPSAGKVSGPTGFRSQAEDWINQCLVGPLLGIAACSVFVMVDLGMVYFGPSIPVFPVTLCAVLALFTSIPMSYTLASSRLGVRAKVFSGSIVFVVAGCALWSFTLLLAVLFSYNLWALEHEMKSSEELPKLPTAYMGTFIGSIGLVAQLLLLQAPEPRGLRSADNGSWGSLKSPMRLTKRTEHRAGSLTAWLYSCGAVMSWVVYCNLQTMIPRHLAPTQVFSLLACTAIVIVSAWWIQQHILSGGHGVFNDVYPRSALVSPLLHLSDDHPAFQLGADCYLRLVLFLSAPEAAALSKTCRALRSIFSENLWRDVFRHRLLRQGKLSARHAAMMEAWETAHCSRFDLRSPLAYTSLTRIEDAVFTAVCRLELPRWRSFASEMPGVRFCRWKALCVGDGRDFYVKQCVVCSEWELFSTRGHEWERSENCSRRSPSTWVVVCRCQARRGEQHLQSAHRVCVEKQMSDTALLDAPSWCEACKVRLVEDTRLPSLRELVSLTWEDVWSFRQDFGGGFFVVVPSCSAVLATTLRSFGWESRALYAWTALLMSICFVAHSQWFDERLRRLGGDESASFVAYQRLYHALVLSSLAHVFWCSPYTSWFDLGRPALVRVVANLSLHANFAFLAVVGIAALVVYWRAHYLVKTVRETSPHGATNDGVESIPGHAEAAPSEPAASCILCQLLICSGE